ncbi:MAG: V-type ATP synthase subunit I [Firmicutes bacterium]|nr:V-type ATP synthase subunit I [Bacillota bacterium]
MAIEKMTMMNVVGLMDYVDDVSREILLCENVDIVNALNQIKDSHFTLSVAEENVEELVDMNTIKPFEDNDDYKEVNEKINKLKEMYNNELKIDRKYVLESYDFNETLKDINDTYEILKKPYEKIVKLREELKKIDNYYNNFIHMKSIDVKIEELTQLNYFTFSVGTLTKEDRFKLKRNYENISAIVLHTGTSDIGEVYLVMSPKELEIETERILRSLNFNKIEFPTDFTGTPLEISKKLEERKKEINSCLLKLNNEFNKIKKENIDILKRSLTRFKAQEKIREIKNEMVSSKNFFYLSGWVPVKEKEKIKKAIEKFKGSIIIFKNTHDNKKNFKPPTKLMNNWIFKPFESLVKMYGIPAHNELDPTVFLSLTYMILFGAMFGDVGQGLILFLIGMFLKRKSTFKSIGSVMTRLSASSIIFGFLYGSIFGFEHVLDPLLVKPFENINLILISAIVIGIFLILMSFLYSIINAIKQRDLKEGVFGRNGLAGLLFYGLILNLIASSFTGYFIIQRNISIIMVLFLIVIMVTKEPLTNLLLNKRPLYHEDVSSYYIESGFDILETILSLLSNTVSFIRVGAFALTHVGLFVAFETIAGLVESNILSVLVLIMGNIIIIFLEGLIVSIQGLRLEYYELFSKYFKGEGNEFKPIKF